MEDIHWTLIIVITINNILFQQWVIWSMVLEASVSVNNQTEL